ncbi:MAG: precorrin-2 C(20)-methyltransferase [Lentisphaerae bacterium]|nr:MAG: precorrin-2 C(20)-methyltransferase [Lentisphaerota bacterium]
MTDRALTNFYSQARPGYFYAVGVGAGSADLVTMRAVRIISSVDVLIAPRSAKAEYSVARDIVNEYLNAGQRVIEHVYPMIRNEDETYRAWDKIAEEIEQWCKEGKSVAQITLGDPLIYSTSSYLLHCLHKRLPRERIRIIPGISAFQATAALAGEKLTLQEDRLTIMPATNLEAVEHALRSCETLVLYKCGGKIRELAELLERLELQDRCFLACYAEQGDREFLTRNLNEAIEKMPGYLATMIIWTGNRKWNG